MTPAAIVLCGGESRRMGRPKADLPFGGERLIERVVRLAAEVCDPIVVVAAPGQDLSGLGTSGGWGGVFDAPVGGGLGIWGVEDSAPATHDPRTDLRVVRDPVSFRGPLQGLATGLAALPDAVELAFATATDVPFLKPAWIQRLVALIGAADLAIPDVDGRLHPLAALYRRATVRPAIASLLAAARMRPVFLMETLKTRLVTADEMRGVDPDLSTLQNLNTPADYEAALRRAGLFEKEDRPASSV